MISSTGRRWMPPARWMRSTPSWVPTRAVLPPAAAAPASGCMVPILYGLAWPNAPRQGGGTSMVAPRAPAAADKPRKRRRVVLPLHQMSRAQGSSCQRSAIDRPPSRCPRGRRGDVKGTPIYTNRWRAARGPGGAGRSGARLGGDAGGGQRPLDRFALPGGDRRERRTDVGSRGPAEEDDGLPHPVVHVHERRRVEDTDQRLQPIVEGPGAVPIALLAGLEQLGLEVGHDAAHPRDRA